MKEKKKKNKTKKKKNKRKTKKQKQNKYKMKEWNISYGGKERKKDYINRGRVGIVKRINK